MKKISSAVLLSLGLMATTADAQFEHPGVLFSSQDLDRMRINSTIEPWRTGYEIILDDRRSSRNYQMQGPHRIVDRNGQNFGDYNDDMDSIFYQALQFNVTGDERFAESAMEMIRAWASEHEFIGGNVPALAAADRGVRMIVASEILRYGYDGWTNELTQLTERYARDVLLPPLYVPDPLRHANQGATQLAGALSLAIYMNDETLFDQVINAFLNEPCAGISNTLPNGVTGDTGRDYGHAFGMVLNLAQTAEVAHKQGVDLFSVLNNRVLAITEAWNAYGLFNEVPYEPYGTCYDFFPTIGERGRGFNDHNTNILLEIVNGAYNVRKGIPNPFTTARINEIPASLNTFLFKKDIDNSTSRSVGEPIAPHTGRTNNRLTGGQVGNPRNASSSFNNNRWTLTASNGDVGGRDDDFQYAYRKMNGDATIVARVNSLDSRNENAKVGLMFRESLDDRSDMHSVHGHNRGQTHAAWRGTEIVNDDLLRDSGSSTNSYRDEAMPAWFKVEINDGRVSTFYAPDSNNEPEDESWSPVSTAFFDQTDDYYIGVFAASTNNDRVTGVFSDVEVRTRQGASTPTISPTSTPTTPRLSPTSPTSGNSFTPDPSKTYYLDVPRHNLRLAATGESEDPFTTSTNTTGDNVEWRFISNGDGSWFIQRAAGGSVPRLRSDDSILADMESTNDNGRFAFYQFSRSDADTHFITLPGGPDGFQRLQMTPEGDIRHFPTTAAGSWESWRITEAPTRVSNSDGRLVQMIKRNASGFAVDGRTGGANEQNIHLWNNNENNVNQQWIEIDRGNGFYSYRKQNTDFCIDGDNGGAVAQNVYLFECGDNNRNQHWRKVDVGGGNFRLEKRNSPEFSLDGGRRGARAQNVYLWSSNNRNQNQHWTFNYLD